MIKNVPLVQAGGNEMPVAVVTGASRGLGAAFAEFHGVDGELSVTDLIAPAVVSQRFVDAVVALGYDHILMPMRCSRKEQDSIS